jgi:hypothetical protein
MAFHWKKGWHVLFGCLALPTLSFGAFKIWNPANPPALLSATGLYANPAVKTTLDTAAKYFEVNSALWSDGAVKKRWIILPPGKHVQWVDDVDYFNYPDSTVLVKTFLQVMGPAANDTVYWETRFLLKLPDEASSRNWWAYSYRWNAAQTDAKLVSLELGFDTAFTYVDALGKTSYKKWTFPSQDRCNDCHMVGLGAPEPTPTSPLFQGRGVLGFFPAQLKKPVQTQAGISNQVLQLFANGVFSGLPPDAASLSKRFIGIDEPIPGTATPAQRQGILDNKARSYLASNCSGCHSARGQKIGGRARVPPNFDYYDLVQHDTPWDSIPSGGGLNDTSAYLDSSAMPTGRAKMKWLAQVTGLTKNSVWKLDLPPVEYANLQSKVFYLEGSGTQAKGYPALSYALYRQLARRMPAADSAEWRQYLTYAKSEGNAKAIAMLNWLFAAPWGSKPWLDTLKAHNFTLDSVMAGYNGTLLRNDSEQMPPIGTYLADTTALKVLAEWLTQEVNVPIRPSVKRIATKTPVLTAHRILLVPSDWKGRVQMLDIQGRATDLVPLGNGRYALPATAQTGLMLFRIGDRHFKASSIR